MKSNIFKLKKIYAYPSGGLTNYRIKAIANLKIYSHLLAFTIQRENRINFWHDHCSL